MTLRVRFPEGCGGWIPPISFHHGFQCSYIIWGLNNRPVVGRSPETLSHFIDMMMIIIKPYHIHKNPPLVPVLSQTKPLHIFTPYFFKIHVSITPYAPGSQQSPFPLYFLIEILYVFLLRLTLFFYTLENKYNKIFAERENFYYTRSAKDVLVAHKENHWGLKSYRQLVFVYIFEINLLF
jgi:hypothetical protein